MIALSPRPSNASQAEMEFWKQWSDKMPQIVRASAEAIPVDSNSIGNLVEHVSPSPRIGVRLVAGALIAAGAFHGKVKGVMKWGVAGFGAGVAATGISKHFTQAAHVNAAHVAVPAIKNALITYADALNNAPQLRNQLAQYLSENVTAQQIAASGIEDAVLDVAVQFGFEKGALQLNLKNDQAEMAQGVLEGMFNVQKTHAKRIAGTENHHANTNFHSR